MMYQSTRDASHASYSAAQVIKMGLAPDGGLFVPQALPRLTSEELQELCQDSYPVRAAKILGKFLEGYSYDELLADCSAAYCAASFPGGAAPLVAVKEGLYALELWHGPTAAFKDMALQIMPRLLSRALEKTGEARKALILVATSGDTGKAALEGYRDIERIRIHVFYPVDGVSRVQKLQMITQQGKNVQVTAIRGNFDDAQTGVKNIFADPNMARRVGEAGYFFSSANSINWGRLAPQIVYYISAYCDLLAGGAVTLGEKIDFCVPTGNFGNIFAGYIARCMGLPIHRLVCASNRNNILTDFLATGTYDRNRPFHMTMSPSMDILISSNLERLLYMMAGEERTTAYMQSLAKRGVYTVDSDVKQGIDACFLGYCADEQQTAATIRTYSEQAHYLADPHTAVALCAADAYRAEHSDHARIMVVDSTASPYKFAADVLSSLTGAPSGDPLEALEQLSQRTETQIPYPLQNLAQRSVRFTDVVDPTDMADHICRCLNDEAD